MTQTVGAIATGSVGPPTELVAATARMCGRAVVLAAGSVDVRDTVIQLAEGVMYTVWLAKLKACAIGSLAVVTLGGGIAGWVVRTAPAQPPETAQVPPAVVQPPPPAIDAPPKVERDLGAITRAFDEVTQPSKLAQSAPTDDEVRKLLVERHLIAIRELSGRLRTIPTGTIREGGITPLLDSLQRVVESEVDLTADPAAHVVAYERWVKAAKAIEDVNQSRYEKGRFAIQDLNQCRYVHVTAQIKLRQAQRAAERLRP
jgi:hypothetical protein